jgi:hypothetical protein
MLPATQMGAIGPQISALIRTFSCFSNQKTTCKALKKIDKTAPDNVNQPAICSSGKTRCQHLKPVKSKDTSHD